MVSTEIWFPNDILSMDQLHLELYILGFQILERINPSCDPLQRGSLGAEVFLHGRWVLFLLPIGLTLTTQQLSFEPRKCPWSCDDVCLDQAVPSPKCLAANLHRTQLWQFNQVIHASRAELGESPSYTTVSFLWQFNEARSGSPLAKALSGESPSLLQRQNGSGCSLKS